MTKQSSDVVEEDKPFTAPPNIQLKWQQRHSLMEQIQHLDNVIGDKRNLVNATSMVLERMEEDEAWPKYRIVRDFLIPVTNIEEAKAQLNDHMDILDKQINQHIEAVKSMRKQHEGLNIEIDIMLKAAKEAEKEKGE